MAKDPLSDKLAVILHADVAGSTELVHQDKQLAHERIRDSFHRFSKTIEQYHGSVLELRGDALLGSFERGSDAVMAALAFQAEHAEQISRLEDDLKPLVRVGISIGEVVIADNTVTGTGVVQAQRVEQLAEPGGVCITAAIHESLSKRMPFAFESLGETELKGFDHAVHVYQVELTNAASIPAPRETADQNALSEKRGFVLLIAMVIATIAVVAVFWLRPPDTASIERMAFPLPDKPSIAVLPFTNMSNDAEQEYFVDGMTENLITDISKVPGLFVIARNSVFTYKGQAVKVRKVAEELGVRYVLEGSVQRAGDQVRINAQLIDATTGGHLWAERYDGSMADVFALQDQVTEQIVSALAVNLKGTVAASRTTNTQAYDDFLKGWAHYQRHTASDSAQAVPYFASAIELDSNYAQAHAAMAAVYWEVWENQWATELGISRDDVMKNAKAHLQQAMKEPSALAHWVASNILIAEGDFATAATEAEQIIALDSNDSSGYATLANALALTGKTDSSKTLLAKAKRLDPLASRLHDAVLKDELDTARQLIANGFPVDARNHQGRTALHLAAIHDREDFAKLLIEAGADIRKLTPRQAIEFRDWGSTPLILTARRGSTEVAQLLISAGADVNGRDAYAINSWSVLHYAVEYGQADVAKLLIENGARINDDSNDGGTPLFVAARQGNSEMVDLLIKHGADLGATGPASQTALHMAIQSGDLKTVQLLLAKGVDVNSRTTAGSYPGQSALHMSALAGQVKIAELLLINGAEIDAIDRLGYTPLRRSIDKRNTEMAKLLISKGANTGIRDLNGISLLHVLAQTDDVNLAALLIDAGADVNARDKNLGFTPLDYAMDGDPAMIELLEQQGSVCTSC